MSVTDVFYSIDYWMFLLLWEPHGPQVSVPAVPVVCVDAAPDPVTRLQEGHLISR